MSMIYLTGPGVPSRIFGLQLASKNPTLATWLQIITPMGPCFVGPVRYVKTTRKGLALIHTPEKLPWRRDFYGIRWMNHRNPDGTYRNSVPLTCLWSECERIKLRGYDEIMHPELARSVDDDN